MLARACYVEFNWLMTHRTGSLTATRKFADVLGDPTHKKELGLGAAGEWGRNTLNAFK